MNNWTELMKKAENGTEMLLHEIRSHQSEMPPDIRDDLIFGALVVLYKLSKTRDRRLNRLTTSHIVQGGAILLIFVTIVALHADVPWLENLVRVIFGT
jgi:hypothetical protein